MPRKRRRIQGGLLPPDGTVADPSAAQVARLVPPPRPAKSVQDDLPPGLLEAIADPMVAMVLLHGPLVEADPAAAVKRWVDGDLDPVLVDGAALSAPQQCQRVWRLAGLPRVGGTAPMLPVLIEMPALLVTEMTERLEQRARRRWPDSLVAVACCSNVYDGVELGQLRRHPRVKVCYVPAVDLGRAYPAIVRELGIDPEVAARLRAGALAAAAGNAVALRATLAFSARGAADGTVPDAGDHTVDRLDAAAGHLLGHHAGPEPEPLYIHAVAPQCCRSLEQISSVCDGLAALDLVDRSSQLAMQRTLVSAVTRQRRPGAPPPVSERRRLNQAFYRFLKTTRGAAGQGVWRDLADQARGALGRSLQHQRLRSMPPVAAAVCLGAVGCATRNEPLELLPWAAVAAAAPDPTAMLDRARAAGCAFEGTAWALAWTLLAAASPALTSVQLQRALETAQAVGSGLLTIPPPLFGPATAVEASAATLLTDYRVIAYKVQ